MWLNESVRTIATMAALLGALTASAGAYSRTLDPAAINDAIAIGLSRSAPDRARFHQPSRATVNQAPIDTIDVVTPFRRVALAAEVHTRNGGRLYGQRDAMAVLQASANQFDVVVELTFHPLNTYVGVPDYSVALSRGDEQVTAADTERVSRFGPRLVGSPLPYPYGGGAGSPMQAQPLTGGSIVARFDSTLVDPTGTYQVVIREAGRELARVPFALGALR
jgi:hypothetical protein